MPGRPVVDHERRNFIDAPADHSTVLEDGPEPCMPKGVLPEKRGDPDPRARRPAEQLGHQRPALPVQPDLYLTQEIVDIGEIREGAPAADEVAGEHSSVLPGGRELHRRPDVLGGEIPVAKLYEQPLAEERGRGPLTGAVHLDDQTDMLCGEKPPTSMVKIQVATVGNRIEIVDLL